MGNQVDCLVLSMNASRRIPVLLRISYIARCLMCSQSQHSGLVSNGQSFMILQSWAACEQRLRVTSMEHPQLKPLHGALRRDPVLGLGSRRVAVLVAKVPGAARTWRIGTRRRMLRRSCPPSLTRSRRRLELMIDDRILPHLRSGGGCWHSCHGIRKRHPRPSSWRPERRRRSLAEAAVRPPRRTPAQRPGWRRSVRSTLPHTSRWRSRAARQRRWPNGFWRPRPGRARPWSAAHDRWPRTANVRQRCGASSQRVPAGRARWRVSATWQQPPLQRRKQPWPGTGPRVLRRFLSSRRSVSAWARWRLQAVLRSPGAAVQSSPGRSCRRPGYAAYAWTSPVRSCCSRACILGCAPRAP
mmetsp:Transcript_36583/g.101538  ORF Transcript_36583/g.101538 Transcript_36583/m.101538 type:complete len:356 (-) Transcript_36583:287-1354(-)